MELKMIEVEDEGSVVKQRSEEFEKSIRNLKKEHDDLMIKNKDLECEKNKAESETEIWKAKCKELEIEILDLKKRLSAGTVQSGSDLREMYWGGAGGPTVLRAEIENKTNKDKDASGTPPTSTASKQYSDTDGCKGHLQYEFKSTVIKCLDFADPHNSISLAKPGGSPPLNHFDISDDSDDGLNTQRRKVGRGVGFLVSSDSEINDNIPIGRLKRKNQLTHSSDSPLKRRSVDGSYFRHNLQKRSLRKVGKNQLTHSSDSPLKRRSVDRSCLRDNPRKRRLRKVGDREDKGDLREFSSKSTENQNNFGISENLNDALGEDEEEEDESCSEGESLGDFIVSSSDASGTDSGSNSSGMSAHDSSLSGDCSGDSENESIDLMTYTKLISGFKRERTDKLKWEYEADMLADFAKCPELCMMAVCAIYRQQTTQEKSCKATIFRNGRGFNHIHAESGSSLAEFLTDGDPKGDVIKSVKELQGFYPNGVEQCRKLANHYSKQLFEIYKNEEDPFFHPRAMSAHGSSFSGDCSGESENKSLDIMTYTKVISGFKRERKDKLKWEYEADMLADFAKCPEFCMMAVCAIYRRQTTQEKSCKATIFRNGRGFNHIHAESGSSLAEFLTDGDPKGDMIKSVNELERLYPNGVEQCRKLANHYSKQLFEIYKNEEDPFFHPRAMVQ